MLGNLGAGDWTADPLLLNGAPLKPRKRKKIKWIELNINCWGIDRVILRNKIYRLCQRNPEINRKTSDYIRDGTSRKLTIPCKRICICKWGKQIGEYLGVQCISFASAASITPYQTGDSDEDLVELRLLRGAAWDAAERDEHSHVNLFPNFRTKTTNGPATSRANGRSGRTFFFLLS